MVIKGTATADAHDMGGTYPQSEEVDDVSAMTKPELQNEVRNLRQQVQTLTEQNQALMARVSALEANQVANPNV
jgi:uncharacterized protein YlxW (UPF0749 family)